MKFFILWFNNSFIKYFLIYFLEAQKAPKSYMANNSDI